MKLSLELIFSLIALVLVIVSIMVKRRKLSIFIQGSSCGVQLICDILINAPTAAIGEVIDVTRSALFIYKEKFSQHIYLAMLVIFELVVIASCVYSWPDDGALGLLPMFGTMFRTYAAWQPRMGLIRLAGIVTGLTYIPYYLLHGDGVSGVVLAIGYAILLVVGVLEMIKHRDFQGGDGCSPDDKPLPPDAHHHGAAASK